MVQWVAVLATKPHDLSSLIRHSMDSPGSPLFPLLRKGEGGGGGGAQLADLFCHVFVSFVGLGRHLLTILSQNRTE